MLNRLVSRVVITSMLITAIALSQTNTPQLVSAMPADSAVQLRWNAVPGATSYNIYWDTGPNVTPSATGHATNPGVAYTVASLQNGTKYYFVITAVTAAGESAVSNELSQTPAPPQTAAGNLAKSGTPVQPSTNVGQSPDTNIQTPTMTYVQLNPAAYPVIGMAADKPNGKITYDPNGVENVIRGACRSEFKTEADFNTVFSDGQTYTMINVINLAGSANAQNVTSNNWYLYSKGKSFLSGFAGGWQLADFDGATRLYGTKKVLLLSILENKQTSSSPTISYTLTITKQVPTNVANAIQLLGLVFQQAPTPGLEATPGHYWACSAAPMAYKTSSIKVDLSYTPDGGTAFTPSQSFTSEAKQRWDISFAFPVKKASALQFNSTANTVTASKINKSDLFAVADFYPYPVDLANNRFTFIPGFFGGVAMNSQPLHSLIFGASVGLKLAQVYVGALLIKQQDLNGLSVGGSATPSQLAAATRNVYKPSFSIGIKISVKAAATAISGSKK